MNRDKDKDKTKAKVDAGEKNFAWASIASTIRRIRKFQARGERNVIYT